MSQVSRPTRSIVPISLYQVPSQLWHVLRKYKDGSGPGAALFAMQVAAMIARFTEHHFECISASLGGAPDLVTSVPSTRSEPRPGQHPIQAAVLRVAKLAPLHEALLVRGSAAVGHRQANEQAFAVTRPLAGERILLIDDTYTSGARVQSAASALHLASAAAVTGVVIGRVIDPSWNDNCRRIWEQACQATFSFDQCCLCPP